MGSSAFDDNEFMDCFDERIFESNPMLGYTFVNSDVIGSDRFHPLEEVVAILKEHPLPAILNLGDSSTSGWESHNASPDRHEHDVFFSYKTYSDLMREQFSCPVVNAGVPGYTSLQGLMYAACLLSTFAKEGLRVSDVTLFFGNNDCTFNRKEDKTRLYGKNPSKRNKGQRIMVPEYADHMKSLVGMIRAFGAEPYIIMPPVHYDWEPGLQSHNHRAHRDEVIKKHKDTWVVKDICKAIALWGRGDYHRACELDILKPRITKPYRNALRRVARQTKTPLIDIQSRIPLTDNDAFFADYCHPLEPTNQMIVDGFREARKNVCSPGANKTRSTKGPSSTIYAMH